MSVVHVGSGTNALLRPYLLPVRSASPAAAHTDYQITICAGFVDNSTFLEKRLRYRIVRCVCVDFAIKIPARNRVVVVRVLVKIYRRDGEQ